MFINISKFDDYYVFAVGDDPTDPAGTFLQSEQDAHIIPGAQSRYSTFLEAHSHASQIASEHPSLVLSRKAAFVKQSLDNVSPENTAVATLEEQPEILDGMLMQIKGSKEHEKADKLDALLKTIEQAKKGISGLLKEVTNDDNEERLDNALKRLKIVEKSAKRLRNRFPAEPPETPDNPEAPEGVPAAEAGLPQMPGTAPAAPSPVAPGPAMPPMPLSPYASRHGVAINVAKGVLRAFGEKSAQAIRPSHSESYLEYIEFDPSTESYHAYLADRRSSLCMLTFNSDLLLDGIYPVGPIAQTAAYHSPDFFAKYWEPIVEAVGHFCINGVVLTHRHSQSSRRTLAGWNLEKKIPTTVHLDIPSRLPKNAQSVWRLRIAESPTAPEQWERAQVRCLKKLPSYYERTGVVRSVANRGGYLDINVDFGRDGVVTLTNNDLELITKLNETAAPTA